MRTFLKQFKAHCQGIILVGIIAITFIILSSIIWLVLALVVNRVFDGLMPIYLTCDPRALATGTNALNAFGVSIVVVDIMFLVWWGLSAQKKGSREDPALGVGF